jgi:hypothetical protein
MKPNNELVRAVVIEFSTILALEKGFSEGIRTDGLQTTIQSAFALCLTDIPTARSTSGKGECQQ